MYRRIPLLGATLALALACGGLAPPGWMLQTRFDGATSHDAEAIDAVLGAGELPWAETRHAVALERAARALAALGVARVPAEPPEEEVPPARQGPTALDLALDAHAWATAALREAPDDAVALAAQQTAAWAIAVELGDDPDTAVPAVVAAVRARPTLGQPELLALLDGQPDTVQPELATARAAAGGGVLHLRGMPIGGTAVVRCADWEDAVRLEPVDPVVVAAPAGACTIVADNPGYRRAEESVTVVAGAVTGLDLPTEAVDEERPITIEWRWAEDATEPFRALQAAVEERVAECTRRELRPEMAGGPTTTRVSHRSRWWTHGGNGVAVGCLTRVLDDESLPDADQLDVTELHLRAEVLPRTGAPADRQGRHPAEYPAGAGEPTERSEAELAVLEALQPGLDACQEAAESAAKRGRHERMASFTAVGMAALSGTTQVGSAFARGVVPPRWAAVADWEPAALSAYVHWAAQDQRWGPRPSETRAPVPEWLLAVAGLKRIPERVQRERDNREKAGWDIAMQLDAAWVGDVPPTVAPLLEAEEREAVLRRTAAGRKALARFADHGAWEVAADAGSSAIAQERIGSWRQVASPALGGFGSGATALALYGLTVERAWLSAVEEDGEPREGEGAFLDAVKRKDAVGAARAP